MLQTMSHTGPDKPIKVHGSSSAFAFGNLIVTQYSSGCLRNILLKYHDVKEPFPEHHKERGKINEDLFEHEARLKRGCVVDREVPVVEHIDDSTGAYFSGRIDYRVTVGDESYLVELKSTESSNVLKEVIGKGNFKTDNLAQLVAYMLVTRLNHGQLIYTYFERDSTKALSKAAERVFDVWLHDDGSIIVDGKRSQFTVHDQLAHRHAVVDALKRQCVSPRPYKWSDFDGPCKWCPFAKVCDSYDDGYLETTEQFIQAARQTVTEKGK